MYYSSALGEAFNQGWHLFEGSIYRQYITTITVVLDRSLVLAFQTQALRFSMQGSAVIREAPIH